MSIYNDANQNLVTLYKRIIILFKIWYISILCTFNFNLIANYCIALGTVSIL